MITLLISALRTQINEMKVMVMVMVITYWFISSWLAGWLEGVLGN